MGLGSSLEHCELVSKNTDVSSRLISSVFGIFGGVIILKLTLFSFYANTFKTLEVLYPCLWLTGCCFTHEE